MPEYLSEGLRKTGFSPTEISILVPKMESYIRELKLYNSAYNLVNTDDHDQLVIHHVLDSLSAVPELKKIIQDLLFRGLSKSDITIADIGSGGGFPGIPLAAAFPDYRFTLVERMAKRCAFLENCVIQLGLSNTKVLNLDAEKIPSGSVRIAVFRAFRPLTQKMFNTLIGIVASGGLLAAYKARENKIKEEMAALAVDYKILPLTVPFLTEGRDDDKTIHERNLVLIQKR
ncbi:MAG: 16S rRNA (guanine(527)-N(7))-methyltransferase RsmG [Treponema sp.]|jgi:16S rRNA (guanine527-N7)-methyltransferase|nr:16S rRNA (guanine(527)-N(7))-methyltransferase RsmG [Treponema sp.]